MRVCNFRLDTAHIYVGKRTCFLSHRPAPLTNDQTDQSDQADPSKQSGQHDQPDLPDQTGQPGQTDGNDPTALPDRNYQPAKSERYGQPGRSECVGYVGWAALTALINLAVWPACPVGLTCQGVPLLGPQALHAAI